MRHERMNSARKSIRPGGGLGIQGSLTKVVIRFSAREEPKALPILLRRSPGFILPNRTYVVSEETALLLRDQGIKFTLIAKEGNAPVTEGGEEGERI